MTKKTNRTVGSPVLRRIPKLLVLLVLLGISAACSDAPAQRNNGNTSANTDAVAEANKAGNQQVEKENGHDGGSVEAGPADERQNDSGVLVPVPVSDLSGTAYGYLDESGQIVIPARFSYAGPFEPEGWAQAYTDGEEGQEGELQLIDRTGEPWFTSKNASVVGFEGSAVVVLSGDRYVLLEAGTGKKLLDTADVLSAPKNGRIRYANVATNGRRTYGYMDLSGKPVVEARYEAAEDFNEGKAVVKRGDGDYALIDGNGTVVADFAKGTFLVTGYGGGMVAFKEAEDRPYGYADERGKVVIAPKYFSAQPFADGVAAVSVGSADSWRDGLIDARGGEAAKPDYDTISRTGELYLFGENGEDDVQPLYAPGDAGGPRTAGKFRYESIAEAGEGMYYATDGKETVFLKADGSEDRSMPVFGGSATVRVDGNIVSAIEYDRVRILRRDGTEIWKEERSFPVKGGVSIVEQADRMPPNKSIYYPKLTGMANREAERALNETIRQDAAASLDDYRNPDEDAVEEDAEWADATEVSGDYEAAELKGNLLVLMLTGYQYSKGAAHGNPWTTYLNIDLSSGEVYRLGDLITDERGLRVVSELVEKRMEADTDNDYWTENFEGIGADASFYIEGDSLVLYYNPYEIAPYAAGFPSFAIPFAQIDKWIDKSGSFWKSMQ